MQFTLRDPVTTDESVIALSSAELAKGLQYSGSAGIPELLDWFIGLQESNHGRKRGEGWDLCFGTGSSDLIYKVRYQLALLFLYRKVMRDCANVGARE